MMTDHFRMTGRRLVLLGHELIRNCGLEQPWSERPLAGGDCQQDRAERLPAAKRLAMPPQGIAAADLKHQLVSIYSSGTGDEARQLRLKGTQVFR